MSKSSEISVRLSTKHIAELLEERRPLPYLDQGPTCMTYLIMMATGILCRVAHQNGIPVSALFGAFQQDVVFHALDFEKQLLAKGIVTLDTKNETGQTH